MESYTRVMEIEARTVEDAIRKASRIFHVPDNMSIEVLKEEQKGLFGMEGADLAKIRITVPQR